MKKSVKLFAAILVAVLLVSSVSAVVFAEKSTAASTHSSVLTTEETVKARLENILNNNRAFGNDFSSVYTLIKRSSPSFASVYDDGRVPTERVAGFIYSMYGVDIYNVPDENGVFYSEDEYISLLPSGFSTYSHKIKSFHENEDGTLTVYSSVKATPHDTEVCYYDCVSRFLSSEDSDFGFFLLSSELLDIE